MPKRKKKRIAAVEDKTGTEQESRLDADTTRPAPERPSQVRVEETALGGERVLAVDEEQPLMSEDSGDSWNYQADRQVVDVLEQTEHRNTDGEQLAESLRLHNSESPILSGGDVDAAWEYANEVGEEAVGGTVATPDQDRVDQLGEAVGLVYQDEEPLNTEEKLQKRDRDRWELKPASDDR